MALTNVLCAWLACPFNLQKVLARGNIESLGHEITQLGLTLQEVKQVSFTLARSSDQNVAMPWDAEYAQLMMKSQLIESDTSALMSSSLLIPGSKLTPTFISRVKARMKKLESAQLNNQPMAFDSPEFDAAFRSLVEYEVASRTQSLSRLVSRYNFVESLFNKVAGIRILVSKLLKSKTAIMAQIDGAYAGILAWIEHPKVKEAEQTQPFSFATKTDTWKVGADVMAHDFPWTSESPTAEDGRHAYVLPLAQRYRRILQEYERAVEEEKIVEEEKVLTLMLYETQLHALTSSAAALKEQGLQNVSQCEALIHSMKQLAGQVQQHFIQSS